VRKTGIRLVIVAVLSCISVAALTAKAGVIINYQFDGSLADSTGNSPDATVVTGAVSYATGVTGQAAVFDGSTLLAMPDNTIKENPNFTMSLRFKTASNDMPIVGYGNQPYPFPSSIGNFIPIVGITTDGLLEARLWDGASAFTVTSTGRVDNDLWHRVDVVANTTAGTLEAFLDGVSIGSQSSTVNHLDMSKNFIGGSRSDGYYPSNLYTGALDSFIFSSTATNPPAPTVPDVPTIGTATAGDTQATVTFTPPADNGGSPITSYMAVSSPGSLTGTCSSSPCTTTGLTNGTAYTFTVVATNAVGNSSASSASNSVTPIGSQTITFNNPGAQTFGTSLTLSATASSGLPVGFSSDTPAVCTITSGGALTIVAVGTCTVSADQAGNAAFSAAPQVQQSFIINATVPGAPTGVTATAGSGEATVSWTAPASNGGADITGYTVTASLGGATCTTTGATSCTVPGLTNGTAYTFTVVATNSQGDSSASAASNSVTPGSAPLGLPTPVPTLPLLVLTLLWLITGGVGLASLRRVKASQ